MNILFHILAPFTFLAGGAGAQEPSNDCGCVRGSGEFCGSDGNCHLYSCEEWYEFGPRNFTGNDDGASLECQDIPMTVPGPKSAFMYLKVFYPSVEYRCVSLEPPPIQMGFTKQCLAIGPNSEFTCYGLAESTNFQPFLDEVTASGLNCTDDKYDETGYPKFSYRVVYEYTGNIGITVNAWGFNSTTELNETLALSGTMFASYKDWTNQPTTAPTKSPTLSPTWKMEGNSALMKGNAVVVSTVVALSAIVSLMI